MEAIIIHILENFMQKFFAHAESDINDIDLFTFLVSQDCTEMAKQLTEALLDDMNSSIREDKEMRKEQGLVMHKQDRPRSILTQLGLLEYERDYYKDKNTGEFIYPLDQMISARPNQRIGDSICADLINAAADESYQKATEHVTGGAVSRQTVKNQIRKLGPLEKPVPEHKSDAKEIHIFADECHINTDDGHSKMIPYAVLTEGINKEDPKRHKTVNPTHFTCHDLKPATMWKEIMVYIQLAYNEDCKVYIHGDGANWIKAAKDYIPNCEFALDEFHLQQQMTRLKNLYPKISIRKRLTDAIQANDKQKADGIFKNAMIGASKDTVVKTLGIERYIDENWDAIQSRFKPDMPGSCTEGQVSHGISERMSRNPMGWSLEGAGDMAVLRAYRKSGYQVTRQDIHREDKGTDTLSEYATKLAQKAMDTVDWSLFEKKTRTAYAASGTQTLLHSLGATHSIISM